MRGKTVIKFRRLKSPRNGECMSCEKGRVSFVDSDGSEFCSKRCVTEWHGEIPEVTRFTNYERIPRDRSKPDVIYICADDSVCVTPDGIGFYWFDSVEEAQDDMGDLKIIRLDGIWED